MAEPAAGPEPAAGRPEPSQESGGSAAGAATSSRQALRQVLEDNDEYNCVLPEIPPEAADPQWLGLSPEASLRDKENLVTQFHAACAHASPEEMVQIMRDAGVHQSLIDVAKRSPLCSLRRFQTSQDTTYDEFGTTRPYFQ